MRRPVRRERIHHSTEEEQCRGRESDSERPLHLIRRGGDVVHDLHIRNTARTVTDAACLHVCGVSAENGHALRILHNGG